MTTDKNGEEQKRRQAVAQQVAQAIRTSGIAQAEIARRISDILGRPIGRSVVNKVTKARRGVSDEELSAIRRAMWRYGEKGYEPMTSPREAPFNVKHDGDRETAIFDVARLRRTLLAALLSPDMDLGDAQKLVEGWIESLRISAADEQSRDDSKP